MKKNLPALSVFTGVYSGSIKKAKCNVMLCSNLLLYKKILRARQLLFKGRITQRDLTNGPELLKYVLAI